ncbi:hypothetical protein AZH53_10655 [Methanomicrobiaceae archaeon CYW5]|uniref:adenosylcobinamide amidohydrolase n=1 Tax=Methanovulcanius yangii TaxID=1789227 RepID=UPI0029C9BE6D|nr:adenosylcobinamide amidohydrolase [Methanovulcanius yangii]MBT8508863.1 hypothetical protein [Methanovulcanius yangii]
MRYFLRGETLFLRGTFHAASTGIGGGIRDVSTICNSTVNKDFNDEDPLAYIHGIARSQGYGEDIFGLLTAVGMRTLCALTYDYVTVFITAGVTNRNPQGPGTINIIVYTREACTEGALLELIITATEAKADALRRMGYDFTGTTTDAVIACHEGGEVLHQYAGTLTDLGAKVYESILHGLPEALGRFEGEIPCRGPAFFILSTIGTKRWFEWEPEGCPYYPCHGYPGQRCDFCYCPFYPCKDETLGKWTQGSSGKKVWSCEDCTLPHEEAIVEKMLDNPDITLDELKELRRKPSE